MIYEIGSKGLMPCGVNENESKNSLPIGTILKMEGYSYPSYVVVKNLGISERFPSYGATYLTVNPENYQQDRKQAYTLKHISQKKDGRIQVYITDEILPADEVLILWEKSEIRREASENIQQKADEVRIDCIERGKKLFAQYIPAEAKALIIAEKHQDDSEIQTDYFNHRTTATIILGWSASDRDNFKEMRKAALIIPETRHLGPGKGHFEARVIIGADIISNGSYYNKGQYSHWHREKEQGANGNILVFSTKEEAQAHIDKIGQPEAISFDGVLIPFEWSIEEDKLEHREKYSMGDGYYLKDGHGDSTGWAVRKQKKYRPEWSEEYFLAMGRRCIMEETANV